MPDAVLALQEVTVRFGGVTAVSELSLSVSEGEIFAIIGPNGAGKTTVFNTVTGVYQPVSGSIEILGTKINGLKPHKITRLGIARTFQNIRLFANMTVLENAMVGADVRSRSGIVGVAVGTKKQKEEEMASRDKATEILRFVGIVKNLGAEAQSLSYGDQRRLEIARALSTSPRIILLDEPAAGMNPVEKTELQALIRKIRDSGVTVVLIEHDMSLVMAISDRITVLDFGKKLSEGLPSQVRNDPAVIEAYLGVGSDAS